MKFSRTILPFVFGLMSFQAHAVDLGGNWNFDYNGTLSLVSVNDSTGLGVISGLVNAALINGSVNAVGLGTTVSQSSASSFTAPISAQVTSGLFSGFTAFSGSPSGSVSGSSVTLAGPSFLTGSVTAGVPAILGLELRLALPSTNLTGSITGVDSGNMLMFGDRAYQITGDPGTLGLLTLQARLNTIVGPVGNFVDAGVVQVSTNSWSLSRPSSPVPEPGSLLAVSSGLCLMMRRRRAKKCPL